MGRSRGTGMSTQGLNLMHVSLAADLKYRARSDEIAAVLYLFKEISSYCYDPQISASTHCLFNEASASQRN